MAKYRIDPDRSQLWADARSSLHPIKLATSGLEGEVVVETADGQLKFEPPPTGRLELDVDRLKTGNSLYDRELSRRLEARRYPRLRGTVKEAKDLGGGKLHLRGELSFHGTTTTVEGNVTLRVIDENTVEVEGEQTFDMRQFGLDPPNLIIVKVYPDVKVRAKVIARRVGS